MKTWFSKIFGKEQKPPPADGDEVVLPRTDAEQTIHADSGRTVLASAPNDPQALHAAEAQVAAEWKVGDVILDLYEVKHVFEGGGMGLVYRVHHRGWNMDLAVKSPRNDYFKTEAQKENFTHECETWINLGLHPHIVSCHYIRTLGGMPRVFAEYVEGGSLKDWIDSRKLYEGGKQESLKRILDIAIQVAWGLHYAHEQGQGLIHQDVKPANVMMMPDGTAKITDFGLAKARAASGDPVVAGVGRSILVSSGGMTPAYCSPEQANKQELSRKTDIWSWAVSVLEMFTGEVCWQSGIAAPEVLKRLDEVRIGGLGIPVAPSELLKLLERCFASELSGRPADFQILADILKEIYQTLIGEEFARGFPEAAKLGGDTLNNQALSLLDLGKGAEAEKLFNEALRAEPSHLEATYNRGLMLWRLGKMTDDALIRQLEDLKTLRADDWRPGWLIGNVHIERGDAESAVAILEATATNVDNGDVVAGLAKAKLGIGNWPRCLRTLTEHTQEITSVAMSADGRSAISGSCDESLRVWELATGRCLRTFQAHTHAVWSVALNGDGRLALSGGNDETLRLWELSNGRCVRTFEGHSEMVIAVALSADGRLALSGGQDETLRLWELSTGLCLRTFEGHKGWVMSVALSADGRLALSAGKDETLRLWELSSGRCFRIFQGHTDDVTSVAFSADGRCALSGSRDATLRLWDLSTGRCLRTFAGHTATVFSVVLSAEGHWALSGSGDGTLRLWELSTGRCLRTFAGHTSWVRSIALSFDGRRALSGSRDKTLRLWELRVERPQDSGMTKAPLLPSRIITSESALRSDREFAAIISQGKIAASQGDWAGVLGRVAQARSLPQHETSPGALELKARAGLCSRRRGFVCGWSFRIFEGHTKGVGSVAFSCDGRWALSGSWDKTLRLWELSTGRCIRTFEGHTEGIGSVAMSADGRWALSGSDDRTLRLWELSTGRCLRTIEGGLSFVRAVALSADGRWALSGSAALSGKNTLGLWELSTGRCVRTFEQHANPITSIAVTDDGRWAVSGGRHEPLRLWEICTGRCVRIFEGHTNYWGSVALSADGRWASSGSEQNTFRLWELSTGRCVRTFEGHTGEVMSVTLSADGRWGLSGSMDKTLRLWELSTGRCLRIFEGNTDSINCIAMSADGRWAVSNGQINTVRLWDMDWDYEFPGWTDWDEGARRHAENFLTLHCAVREDGVTRAGKPAWTDEDFQKLVTDLQHRGFGWLRPEGVRRELEKMTAEWHGPPLMPWEQTVK